MVKKYSEMTEEEVQYQKAYNKMYFEIHKEHIAQQMQTKEACKNCGRIVSHHRMNRHMKTNYCKNRSNLNIKQLIMDAPPTAPAFTIHFKTPFFPIDYDGKNYKIEVDPVNKALTFTKIAINTT